MAISKLSTSAISSNVKYSQSVIPSVASTDSIKMIPIAWVNLASNQSGITIDNIPQTYKNLKIFMNSRFSTVGYYGGSTLTFNNDSTGTNYTRFAIYSSAGAPVGFTGANAADSYNYSTADSASSGDFGQSSYDIIGYSDTDRYKSFLSFFGHVDPNSASLSTTFDHAFLQHSSHIWQSTSAITRIDFTGSFKAGTTLALYGYGVAG